MTAKKKILALLSEDEAKHLEASRRILNGSKRAVLISKDVLKWQEWGIECINALQSILRCKACGATWQPHLIDDTGKLPARYWQCPTGCNKEIEQARAGATGDK